MCAGMRDLRGVWGLYQYFWYFGAKCDIFYIFDTFDNCDILGPTVTRVNIRDAYSSKTALKQHLKTQKQYYKYQSIHLRLAGTGKDWYMHRLIRRWYN